MYESSALVSEIPPHLDNLNKQQYEAVTHCDGPLLIFAGAGSGKTRVLTRRIAYLIKQHGVTPQRILAVTFTNKAAQEMKERVANLFPHGLQGTAWVSTFHSICTRILRRHAELLDYTPQFAIYDRSDSMSVLKGVYKQHKLTSKDLNPRLVFSCFDRAKNNYYFADHMKEHLDELAFGREVIPELFRAYQRELLKANAMDFGDLITNVVTLFRLEPQVLELYRNQFEFIMVDEYQDTNKVQYMLIKMLAEGKNNLCVVGDDDQSIYGFRGASINNILNFRTDFPQATTILLEQNYRSSRHILDAANAVIACNRHRQVKKMRTDNAQGEPIVVYGASNERDEASFIQRKIDAHRAQGIGYNQMAIFYRTNAQSRAIEEALYRKGIPYEIYGGFKFYDRKEIKDILGYLRLGVNHHDNEAFLRVVNSPARGLGATSVQALVDVAYESNSSLFTALSSVVKGEVNSRVSKAAVRKFRGFYEIVCAIQEKCKEASDICERADDTHHTAISDLLEFIASKSGYLEALKKENTPESLSRVENIKELWVVAQEFSRSNQAQGEELSLRNFLDRTSLSSDLDNENVKVSEGEKQGDSISLMTLHLAKGLEFPVVFLTGLEEGILPHSRALQESDGIEEERRLCYVGITRAQEMLYMSYAMHRQAFRGRGYGMGDTKSRFLYELPKANIVKQRSLN